MYCYNITKRLNHAATKHKDLNMRWLALLSSLTLSTAALAEVPKVAVDIAPVHSLVSAVMGDLGTPDLILPPDGDPHHFQLRPSQMRALSTADLVVWVGPALTPWLKDVLASDATQGRTEVQLLDPDHLPMVIEGTLATLNTEAEEHDHDADHDAHAEEEHDAHDDHADDDHAGHDHGPIDPHIWLDPVNAQHMLDEIAEALAALDAENSAVYARNAETAKARIAALTEQVAQDLHPLRNVALIPYHDAYKYFFIRFDLQISGSLSTTDAAAPSAARLSELRDRLAKTTRPCLFTEPGANENLIASVLPSDSDAVIRHLDGLGTTLTPGPDLYEALIRNMADAIISCRS